MPQASIKFEFWCQITGVLIFYEFQVTSNGEFS